MGCLFSQGRMFSWELGACQSADAGFKLRDTLGFRIGFYAGEQAAQSLSCPAAFLPSTVLCTNTVLTVCVGPGPAPIVFRVNHLLYFSLIGQNQFLAMLTFIDPQAPMGSNAWPQFPEPVVRCIGFGRVSSQQDHAITS